MKKSDLKSKMCVELRNGERYMVVDDVLLKKNGFHMLKNYNEDLKHSLFSDYDIIKVYKGVNLFINFTNDLGIAGDILNFNFEDDGIFELLWDKETLELTLDEIAQKFNVDVSKIKIKK